MAIVTIARETGAWGKITASALAKKLPAILLNKDALEKDFANLGIDFSLLEKYDEKKPGFLSVFTNAQEVYFMIMKAALLRNVAAEKNAVILGRGAHLMLENVPNCFKVRLVAPLEVRCKRVEESLACSRREALQFIKNGDMHRSGFCGFHYDSEWTDVCKYDLVINTEHYDEEMTVDVIADALARFITPAKEEAGRAMVENMLLAQNVKKHILYDCKVNMPIFDVTVKEKGVVILQGATSSSQVKEQLEELAKECMGVSDVVNNVQVSVEKLHNIVH